MCNGMQYDPMQGPSQVHKRMKVVIYSVIKSCLQHHLQRELATDH